MPVPLCYSTGTEPLKTKKKKIAIRSREERVWDHHSSQYPTHQAVRGEGMQARCKGAGWLLCGGGWYLEAPADGLRKKVVREKI